MLLIFLSGCASVTQKQSDDSVHMQYWLSPDRTELLVFFPQKEEAYYFNNNESRLCYTYKIPGKWQPGAESALLLSDDEKTIAGALLYSAEELKDFEGADLVTRAAKMVTEIYEKNMDVAYARAELVPFQSSRPGTMKWTIAADAEQAGRQVEVSASKIFVEIAPAWVAQITVMPDDDDLTRSIIATLASTSASECYWPFIRQYLPQVR